MSVMEDRSFSRDLYERMYLIRHFEEEVLRLFSEGELFGTTHAYIGQEANAVGIIDHLSEKDIIFSSHRCHGHYLAKTQDVIGLLSELMGKETGIGGGRGGSQHICVDNFYTNGIQGGIVPVCSGMALAEKFKKSGAIATVFIGDGTLGEGVIYEAFNMAKLWEAPLLIVLENNRYAQSTPVERSFRGDMCMRLEAFDIPTVELETFDVEEVHDAAGRVIGKVREEKGPHAMVIHTYRFCSHSKSPDGREESEVERWRDQHDPLDIQRPRVDKKDLDEVHCRVERTIASALERAKEAAFPDPQSNFFSSVSLN